MKITTHLTALAAMATLSIWACASESSAPPQWQWGIGIGSQTYKEPIMQLQGPELGLVSRWNAADTLKVEGHISRARLSYDSTRSGRMSGVPQTEGLLRILGPAWPLGQAGHAEPTLQWSYTHNDLRGQSSNGQTGYERHLNNLWAGVRWTQTQMPDHWAVRDISLDLQSLVKGRQLSKLSQVGSAYRDVQTETRHGWALGLQVRIPTAHGDIVPYVRKQHLGRSDTVFNGLGYATEPEHDKLWLGLNWWFN
jgi:hypothetical protein